MSNNSIILSVVCFIVDIILPKGLETGVEVLSEKTLGGLITDTRGNFKIKLRYNIFNLPSPKEFKYGTLTKGYFETMNVSRSVDVNLFRQFLDGKYWDCYLYQRFVHF